MSSWRHDLYQRDKAMYTKHPDEIKKMIVDRPRRVGQKMIRPSAPSPAAASSEVGCASTRRSSQTAA